MLIFETIPVSTLPLHFKSYAKTDEEVIAETESNALEDEIELGNDKENTTVNFDEEIALMSSESDFEIDENGGATRF